MRKYRTFVIPGEDNSVLGFFTLTAVIEGPDDSPVARLRLGHIATDDRLDSRLLNQILEKDAETRIATLTRRRTNALKKGAHRR